jgi:CDP-L-myo-inositol myo-inositolphosphotransferase
MAPPRYEYRNSLKSVSSYPFIRKYLPVDRLIVRPLASVIVRMVYRSSVTPNQLTVISFVIGVAAGLVYLGSRPRAFVIAGILVLVSLVFDCADGMLARAKNMSSRYGAYLDLFFDRIVDFVVLAGISWGFSRYTQDRRILIFGLLTMALYFLQVSLYYLTESYKGQGRLGESAEAKVLVSFLIFLLSLFGRLDVILAGIFLMGCISPVIKIINVFREGKDQTAGTGF